MEEQVHADETEGGIQEEEEEQGAEGKAEEEY